MEMMGVTLAEAKCKEELEVERTPKEKYQHLTISLKQASSLGEPDDISDASDDPYGKASDYNIQKLFHHINGFIRGRGK
jgi:hypothetical protein